jgi:hypothetical protein
MPNQTPPSFEYTCADCPNGGRGWRTVDALVDHFQNDHESLWTPETIAAEIAEQNAMREATA